MRNLNCIYRIIISGGLSLALILSVSCVKESPAVPEDILPIDFSAKEFRLPQSNQYGVIVTLDCNRRSEWWNVAVTLDGKTRKSLLREGRIFEESPSLIIPLGGLNNGRHKVDVVLTDNRDSMAVRHISFHCIGDYTGESEMFYGIHFERPEYEVGLNREVPIALKIGIDVDARDVSWDLSGTNVVIVRTDSAKITLLGQQEGTARLRAFVKNTDTEASADIVVIDRVEDTEITE